jgi:translation initiation factor 2 alpha subunit (eIF-2alpha)
MDLALGIQVFMDEMIEHVINNNIKDPKAKVRGIILAGEASKQGMEDLKQVIETALPEYKDRFLFDIDPVVIGAVGAAHRARQWATKNAIMNPREPAFHDDL